MAKPSKRRRIDRPPSGHRLPPPPPPSNLPDHVIMAIFSLLSVKELIKTSVLSRRWRSTWTTTANIVFDGFRPRDADACSIVDSVLSRCTSTVEKFHVNEFPYKVPDGPRLEKWLRFAERHQLKDLRLGLNTSLQAMYILPQFLFGLSSLVRLQVSLCCFSLGKIGINWPDLKVLSMSNVNLTGDILASILRGSPVLESLELGRCIGLNNVVIDSTSVEYLQLCTNFFDLRELRAPHLRTLRVAGTCCFSEGAEYISLEDISSLVEADLDFEILPHDNNMACDLLKELLEKLCEVPTINIGDWCLQILSLMEMKGVSPPLLTCQNLILHGPVSQWDLPGIAYTLRSSQCLEKLVIHLTGSPMLKFQVDEESKERFNFDEEDFLCSRRGNFESLAEHLKRVEIIGFGAFSFGSNLLLPLIKFLLGHALVLEKLIIKPNLPTQQGQDHLEAPVLRKLLVFSIEVNSFQRASENAEILFYPPLI